MKLKPDVMKVVQDVKNKDFTSALTDAKQLVADAEKEFAPCVNSSINVDKCLIAAAKDLVPEVMQIVQDLQNKDIGSAKTHLLALVSHAEDKVKDCINATEVVLALGKIDIACVIESVQQVIPEIQKIISDFQGKDYAELVKDVLQVVQDVIADVQKCQQTGKKYEGVDIPCLIKAAIQLSGDVKRVISDWDGKEIAKLVKDIVGLVKDAAVDAKKCFNSNE